ncbi:hypothetical protein [Rhodopseudomonas sp.]|uniref:hypothetical protein n=1 Tax=Rhodopseudomonas sp. TaxID=1078 RepID=UPI0039E5831B
MAQGYAGFELWTDRELKSLPRLTNAEILVSTNTTYHDHDIAFAVDAAVFEIAKTRRRITVRELRAKLPSALRAHSYREVMRLVAMRRLLPAVETALLDDDALLLIPGGIDG